MDERIEFRFFLIVYKTIITFKTSIDTVLKLNVFCANRYKKKKMDESVKEDSLSALISKS
jgi:hypothetical protein